jgi:PKD repeat protein
MSDVWFDGFEVGIYGGLHSHDWTVDKSVFSGSTKSYLWYMMGWHHSIINTVLYENVYFAVAIRGSYPPNEDYNYKGGNPSIGDRSSHFLASNDWSHLIANNTYGSPSSSEPRSYAAQQGLYYNVDEGSGHSEDSYFPPYNIMIYNNAFYDNVKHKTAIYLAANRGINTGAVDAIKVKIISNNYCLNDVLDADYSTSNIPMSGNKENFSNFGFNDGNRDYTITSSSGLVDNGNTNLWFPNVDHAGNLRDNTPDVGAYEVPGSSPGPSVRADFDANVTSCGASVSFTNKSTSSEGTLSYSWKFGDGKTSTDKDPTHVYATSGSYTVELKVTSGSLTDTKTSSVNVDFAPKPTNVSAEKLADGKVRLTADGTATINWYDTPTGGTPIGTGKDVTVTSSASNFYAENTTGGGSTYKGGKTDKTTGAYYEWEDSEAMWGLQFNANEDITLKSVKVYNGESKNGSYTGARTFTVLSSSGSSIATATVNVADGEQRLELNMQIPKGTGYLLVSDAHVGLWRDNSGTFNYPYDIGGVVSITADAKYSGVVNTENYHFFYDWEVIAGSAGCTSDRVLASITSLQDDMGIGMSVYPNPVKDKLTVKLDKKAKNMIVYIYNIYGQIVDTEMYNNTNKEVLYLNSLSQGIYIVNIEVDGAILTTQKISIIE